MNDYGKLICDYCKQELPKQIPYISLPVNIIGKASNYYTVAKKFDSMIHLHTECYKEVKQWLEHH